MWGLDISGVFVLLPACCLYAQSVTSSPWAYKSVYSSVAVKDSQADLKVRP